MNLEEVQEKLARLGVNGEIARVLYGAALTAKCQQNSPIPPSIHDQFTATLITDIAAIQNRSKGNLRDEIMRQYDILAEDWRSQSSHRTISGGAITRARLG